MKQRNLSSNNNRRVSLFFITILILTVANILISTYFVSKDVFSSSSNTDGIIELDNSADAASTPIVTPHRSNSENHQGLTTSPKSPAIEVFTKCMLQLEEYYQDFFPQYANARQPFPVSVKIVDDHFYVLISLDTTGLDFIPWTRATTSFACNNVPAILISSHRHRCPTKKSAVVKCPQSLSPNNSTLRTLTIVPLGNEMAKVEYKLDKFLECEQKDIAWFAETRNRAGARPIKTGITTTFSGGREEALEWAVYHHLIGFDHVWMYVNEPWENGKDLPQSLDFLTFIPYNIKASYFKGNIVAYMSTPFADVFRTASQNDALWRARRMGLEWMAFPDLDELVVLGNSALHSNISFTSTTPLKSYLADYKATHGDKYTGIFLRSVPYGKNVHETKKPELMIDYTWRQNLNLTLHCCYARNKLILDVHKNNAVSLHFEASDGKNLFVPKTTDELHVNHYKKRDMGVFNMKHKWLRPPDIIDDTRLRDEYRNRVVELTLSIREGMS
jgi:hypothetical protein